MAALQLAGRQPAVRLPCASVLGWELQPGPGWSAVAHALGRRERARTRTRRSHRSPAAALPPPPPHPWRRAFNDQRYYICDKKLLSLGWKETVTWEEGLARTIEW
jgi:nucleoside-diphosphate-sugar epimerase